LACVRGEPLEILDQRVEADETYSTEFSRLAQNTRRDWRAVTVPRSGEDQIVKGAAREASICAGQALLGEANKLRLRNTTGDADGYAGEGRGLFAVILVDGHDLYVVIELIRFI
jgi:hypothetical protein